MVYDEVLVGPRRFTVDSTSLGKGCAWPVTLVLQAQKANDRGVLGDATNPSQVSD
jgi:hypothetical protein